MSDCIRCSNDFGPAFDPRDYVDPDGERFLVVTRQLVKSCESICAECDEWYPIYRTVWNVIEGGEVIATVPTLAAAEAVVKVEAPKARYQRDHAWESERFLRQMEGWE